MNRILFCAACLLSTPLFAHDHAAHEARPATLVQGLGNLHHPVSTRNPLAQRFFDQGLTCVYAFMHEEAVRSFQRAAALDPKLAMAHWGIALALGPNYNMEMETEPGRRALAAIRRAQELAPGASGPEQAYIAALATRYTDQLDIDPRKPNLDYKDAMRALMQRYPDDLDAATLYADSMMVLRPWQLWSADGKRAEGTEQIVAALESVLRRDPNHLGANHLYIHAIEASPRPERGLPSADRLRTLAPAAGHLVHMPAHIYDRVGDYAGAVAANVSGAADDRAYIKRNGPGGMYPMMYYSHNLHFLAIANAMQGHYREARAAADQLQRHVTPAIKDMPMLEGFLPTATLIAVHFRRWDEVMKLPQPPANLPASTALRHFARGMALAARGDSSAAKLERAQLGEAADAVPKNATWGNNKPADVLRVAAGMLDGQIAVVNADAKSAMAEFAAAAKVEDELAYDEPQPWPLPVRETWGAALLSAGDAAGAEAVFRAELAKHPRSGRALFGLAAALKAQGKPSASVERQFAVAWRGADTKLSIAVLGGR
jgi:hypothetical protein